MVADCFCPVHNRVYRVMERLDDRKTRARSYYWPGPVVLIIRPLDNVAIHSCPARWWWWQFIERENISMLQQHAHYAWATTIIKLIIFVAYGTCWLCLCCHNPPNSDVDYRIFIVRTDVNACDCTRRCTDTEREFALKADSGKKISCRTGESLSPMALANWPHSSNTWIDFSLEWV